MKRIWPALVAAFAICLALAGCGKPKDPAEDFIGKWEVISISSDGEETSEKDLNLLKDLDLHVYLVLNENGMATLDVFGDGMDGTWSVSERGKGSILLDGQEVPMVIKGGKLTLEQDRSSMTFKKLEDSEEAATSADAGHAATYFGGDTINDLDNPTEMDVLVANDDICTIKVTARGTYVGSPAFLFEITNKTDADFLVVNSTDDWAVNGAKRSATLYKTLKPQETLGSVAWFVQTGFDDDVNELTNVTGTIIICDANANNILGEYEFAL